MGFRCQANLKQAIQGGTGLAIPDVSNDRTQQQNATAFAETCSMHFTNKLTSTKMKVWHWMSQYDLSVIT